MLTKKKGMPEESELLLCTVTKIYPTSVFVDIDEYERKSGMIHISEISPGRIRNIHDFVKVGKKIVCKVLRIDLEKGHIDLSLRRVSTSQQREKVEELKREQKAEKIVEFVAGKLKLKAWDVHKMLSEKILKEYDNLYDCFEDFIVDDSFLKGLDLDAKLFKELDEVIRQRIKPPEVEIKGIFRFVTYAPDGADIVKNALVKAEKLGEGATIKYVGAGKFGLQIIDEDFKSAEKTLKKISDFVIKEITSQGGEVVFERIETK